MRLRSLRGRKNELNWGRFESKPLHRGLAEQVEWGRTRSITRLESFVLH